MFSWIDAFVGDNRNRWDYVSFGRNWCWEFFFVCEKLGRIYTESNGIYGTIKFDDCEEDEVHYKLGTIVSPSLVRFKPTFVRLYCTS